MKISRLLFKPKWQDKLAAVRLIAVANDTDPELIEALPELTRSDPDARVRLAALKRLNDYERWRERSTGDADPEIRRAARTAYIHLLCSGASGKPSLKRRVSELETLSAGEMETVATTAKDRDLRAAALERVERPALLAERATLDPDATLRLAALERINDPLLLQRIAERARKTDKTISRVARERVASARISAGDGDAIAARARALCERIEALLRISGTEEDQSGVQREWHALGTSVPTELQARFEGAATVLRNMRSAARQTVAPTPPLADEASAPPAEKDAVLVADSGAEILAGQTAASTTSENDDTPSDAAPAGHEIASRARFDAALAAAAEEARRERERKQAALGRVEALIPDYEQCLDKGDTNAAHGVRKQVERTAAEAGPLPPQLEQRLAPLHARQAELKRWQHWSNQRRRRTLCDEVEALADAGLHPDAIATRIREARDEWQRLDLAEGADAESSGLARRFFGGCQRALKPAQKYFDKRDELRDAQRMQLEALLTRADAPVPEVFDAKAAIALRRELAEAMRSLDRFSPRDRGGLAKRLKQAIATISSRIESHAESVAAAKARLIDQATALALKPDRSSARGVRDLQQQWAAAGEGARGADQKQWREFRAACDRVFAALDAERIDRDAQVAAAAAQNLSTVEAAEALAGDAEVDANALVTRQRELDTRWRALGVSDRDLERRWRVANDKISAHNAALARDKKLARYSSALRKHAILRQLESGAPLDSLVNAWNSEPPLIERFAKPIDARWAQASGATITAVDAAGIENARDLLVRIEFAAGIASPAEDRQRRMDIQVARLSARMRGNAAAVEGESEVAELLANWFAQPGALPEELEQRFASAAAALLAALP